MKNCGKVFNFLSEFDLNRYDPRWMTMHPRECDIQATILCALAHRGIKAFAVDAGAKAIRGRAVGMARRLGATASQIGQINKGRSGASMAGTSDIVGTMPGGRSIYIEVKQPAWLDEAGRIFRSANKPTDDQLAFLQSMHDQGAVVGVAWSPDDVSIILGDHTR